MSVFLAGKGTEICLQSGVLFDPLSPNPDLLTVEDVAYGLAGQFRFAGHTRLTVAQHSVMASWEVEEPHAYDALWHDASEGLGLLDFSRPLKHHLMSDEYRAAESRLMGVLSHKFNFNWPLPEAVKKIDDALCVMEARDLLGRIPREGDPILPDWNSQVPCNWSDGLFCWSPQWAQKEFLKRYRELTR